MVNFKNTALLLFFIAAPCVFASPDEGLKRLDAYPTCRITIINSVGKKVFLKAYVADTDDRRHYGLMFINRLPEDEGMLFVFTSESKQNFWMKNTFIPLSIAYAAKNFTINEIHDMRPLDISATYPSRKPAMYALEVNRGWFDKNKIKPGCIITQYGCLGK
ncbi:MAG: DUF192 domain-containing protein [Spirochaetes bacterium]|jgi:hypothetical protein|nr:DUF192 domain-containing protein [Spirochaetota bacterium]